VFGPEFAYTAEVWALYQSQLRRRRAHHGQKKWLGVLHWKGFILEFLAVDRFTAGACEKCRLRELTDLVLSGMQHTISSSKVATLAHKSVITYEILIYLCITLKKTL
jgi:hypothetical protein